MISTMTSAPVAWESLRLTNRPHPAEAGQRIVGFVVPAADAPIGDIRSTLSHIFGAPPEAAALRVQLLDVVTAGDDLRDKLAEAGQQVAELRAQIADQDAAIALLSALTVQLQNAAAPREAKLALAVRYDEAKSQRIKELEVELAARGAPPQLGGAAPALRLVTVDGPEGSAA